MTSLNPLGLSAEPGSDRPVAALGRMSESSNGEYELGGAIPFRGGSTGLAFGGIAYLGELELLGGFEYAT